MKNSKRQESNQKNAPRTQIRKARRLGEPRTPDPHKKGTSQLNAAGEIVSQNSDGSVIPRANVTARDRIPRLRVSLWVPKSFQHYEMPPEFRRFQNECNYILHRIIVGRNNQRHDNKKYINLHAKTLRIFMQPKAACMAMRFLLRASIIECDNVYHRGLKSKGYRLTHPHQGPLARVLCSSSTMAAHIVRRRMTLRGSPLNFASVAPVHRYLLEWLRQVEINMDMADRAIHMTPDVKCPELNQMTCETIAAKEWEYHICNQGRVHTNITRALTETRACMTVGGEPLINIDIRNSQLVFFTMLLIEERLRRVAKQCSFDSANGSYLSPNLSLSNLYTLGRRRMPSHRRLGTPVLPDKDERKFAELTMQGQLYEHMMEVAGFVKGRKEFKRLFFCYVVYGDSRREYNRRHPLTVAFKEHFPTVYEFILERKRGGYEQLACDMQTREANFMIGTVCKRLMEHHPDVPVITIHDSISTTPRNERLVRRIIMEEFRRLGFRPSLSEPERKCKSKPPCRATRIRSQRVG